MQWDFAFSDYTPVSAEKKILVLFLLFPESKKEKISRFSLIPHTFPDDCLLKGQTLPKAHQSPLSIWLD